MKAIFQRGGFQVELRGIKFSFLHPRALDGEALKAAQTRLTHKAGGDSDDATPEEEAQASRARTESIGFLLAYTWDPAGPHGALDAAAALPDVRRATDEELMALGGRVAEELDAAGLSLADLVVLNFGVQTHIMGAVDVAEASRVANFTRLKPA